MNHVEILKRIADSIPHAREADVGPTGYLDGRVEPMHSMMKGADKWGRIFVTLCLKSLGRDSKATYESCGVITVFQRYTDSDVVTQASNTHCAPNLFLRGAATDDDMRLLEEIIRDNGSPPSAEPKRTFEGVIGGTLQEWWTLVEPKEALSWRNGRATFRSGTI